MIRTHPRPPSSLLPWLLASLAAHAALLAQWPLTAPSAREVADAAAETAVQVQLVQLSRTKPATSDASNRPPHVAAAVHRPDDGGAAAMAPREIPDGGAVRPREPSKPAPPARNPSAVDSPTPRNASEQTATIAYPIPPRAEARTADDIASTTELTSLLHQEIDRHKRYPQSALRMGREGAALIDFRLGPDGHIDDLNIGTSSGVRALDLAAYRAVEAIAPFQPAGRYLDSARRFQVHVVFRID